MSIFTLAIIAILSVILFDLIVSFIIVLINKNKDKSNKELIMLCVKYTSYANITLALILQIADLI